MSGLSERLKSLDAQSTVSKEFRVHTLQGAVLSVVTVFLIVYLVATEIYFNFQVTLEDRVHVNATSTRGIEMEFDISLPEVSCSLINVDAADPTGQSQSLHLDVKHHVWKHRFKMSDDGERQLLIGSKSKLELGSTLLDELHLEDMIYEKLETNKTDSTDVDTSEKDICGSCYGAGEEGECCNTCDDVRRAYRRRGWVLKDLEGIEQCVSKGEINDLGEGCNVHGVVALSSGGGNLHLAPGKDLGDRVTGENVFDILLQSYQKWNVTHTINKIRFGPEYPAAVYQLDGEKRLVTDSSAMYQYYFQIVPTLFRFHNGTTIQTNQYSVTEHIRHITPGSQRGLPGVFFFYEVSSLHVEIVEGYRKGWIAFLTSVCAIIGGVVTIMGMLDQYLFAQNGRQRGGLLM